MTKRVAMTGNDEAGENDDVVADDRQKKLTGTQDKRGETK
jgi:hypothetical protein